MKTIETIAKTQVALEVLGVNKRIVDLESQSRVLIQKGGATVDLTPYSTTAQADARYLLLDQSTLQTITSGLKVGANPTLQVDTTINTIGGVGIGVAPETGKLLKIGGTSSSLTAAVVISPELSGAGSVLFGIDSAPSFSAVPTSSTDITGIRFSVSSAVGDGGYTIGLTGGNFKATLFNAPNKTWTAGLTHTVKNTFYAEADSYSPDFASKVNVISGYFQEPRNRGAAGSWSLAALFGSDSLLQTDKKLYFEGTIGAGPTATNYIGGAANVLNIVSPTINLTASTAIAHGTSVITGTGTVGCGALTSTGVVTATYHQTSTAATANSTGTVAILAKDANLLTNNSEWIAIKNSAGAVRYIPVWS